MSDEPLARRVLLTHATGLHARPCLAIVNLARRFRSKVKIHWRGQTVEAGEILQLMTLGAPQGAELELSASGPDAAEALDALENLIRDDFGMGE